MLDVRYSHLYFYQSLNRLQCGLSAIAELLVILLTRLPSNLRPTARECVHLVTHSEFRSRDKDGDHII